MVLQKSWSLDALPLVDGTSYNAESCTESNTTCLKRYDVQAPTRVCCCTTDGAKINFVTARIMKVDIQRCACHLLALLVKEVCQIGHIFEAAEMCNSLLGMFSQSCINNEWLRRYGSLCKLQGFSDTRWNYIYKMFESVQKNLMPLQTFVTTHHQPLRTPWQIY